MQAEMRQRWGMTALGLGAGLALYALDEMQARAILGERIGLGLTVLTLTFFTALLAMAGATGLRRALPLAALIAGVASGLLAWGAGRFASVGAYLDTGLPYLCGAVLALVPIPFAIAAAGPGWRHYPTLFTESWDMVVRYAAATIFVGIVWAVVLLSDLLLQIVGLSVIGDLLDVPAVPFAVTGAALGLGMAVVTELADLISPDLFLRLLRLLLPVVLAVMGVFLLALPFRGLSGLFGTQSAAGTLLVSAAVAASLVTTATAQTEGEATASPLLRRAARIMALILPLFTGLAAWAIWQRVAQYGWTPDRVLAAAIAVLGLGYGAVYGLAAIRRGTWMARIRQGNTGMALVLIAGAALLLTPVLNPQAISVASQMARLAAGQVDPAELDLRALSDWGRAGAEARATLEARAKEPGQEALAAALTRVREFDEAATADTLRAGVIGGLRVLPQGRDAERDALLAAQPPFALRSISEDCASRPQPACLLLFADFWPDLAGDEAILLVPHDRGWRVTGGYARIEGAYRQTGFGVQPKDEALLQAAPVLSGTAVDALIAAAESGPVPLEPMPGNRLRLDGVTVFLLP